MQNTVLVSEWSALNVFTGGERFDRRFFNYWNAFCRFVAPKMLYIRVCVCVCVCVWRKEILERLIFFYFSSERDFIYVAFTTRTMKSDK
jgi:hypothetical protein